MNPGVFIYGIGTDMDLMPTLKLFLNANYIPHGQHRVGQLRASYGQRHARGGLD